MSLRIVTMGTGPFAVPTFRALCDGPHEIVALFTQPDRTGQGHHRHRNPMKELAIERGVPVRQPERAKDPEALAALCDDRPDLCVVADYGQILPAELLAIPRLGAINAHASLLPRHRGAAPVQYALWSGDVETGVTIFRIEPRLDAGPMLAIERTPIGPRETAAELEARLADMAARMIGGVVDGLARGTLTPIVQDSALATKAPRLKKSDGEIDWTRSAFAIDCQVRAMQPWPKTSTTLHRTDHPPQRLLIADVVPCDDPSRSDAPPGTVVASDSVRIVVRCGQGAVELARLQPEGKRVMTATEFLHGHAVRPGDRLGPATETA